MAGGMIQILGNLISVLRRVKPTRQKLANEKREKMDKDLAKLVAQTAFRSAAEINNLIPLLKEYCTEEECRDFGIAIATASSGISQQIMGKIFAMHPDLEAEFESQIRKYGRPI